MEETTTEETATDVGIGGELARIAKWMQDNQAAVAGLPRRSAKIRIVRVLTDTGLKEATALVTSRIRNQQDWDVVLRVSRHIQERFSPDIAQAAIHMLKAGYDVRKKEKR
jgi:hypothetical protein